MMERILIKGMIIMQMLAFFVFSPYLMAYGLFRLLYSFILFCGILLMLSAKPRILKAEGLVFLYMIMYFFLQIAILRQGETDKVSFILILAVSYLFNRLCFERGYKDFYIKSMLIGLVVILLYGIVEWVLKENILFINLFRNKYHNRSIGMTMSGNYGIQLGWENPLLTACLLSSLTSVLCLIKNAKIRYMLIVLCVAEAFCTGKRTGTLFAVLNLAFMAGLYFTYLHGKLKRKPYWIIILMSAFVFIVAPVWNGTSIFDIAIYRFLQLRRTESLSGLHRLVSIQKSMGLFLQSDIIRMLIGHGTSSLGTYFARNEIMIVSANYYVIDNSYISFLYDYGVVNTILVMGYIVHLLHSGSLCVRGKMQFETEDLVMLTGFAILLITIAVFDALTWFTSVFLLAMYVAYFQNMLVKNRRSRR